MCTHENSLGKNSKIRKQKTSCLLDVQDLIQIKKAGWRCVFFNCAIMQDVARQIDFTAGRKEALFNKLGSRVLLADSKPLLVMHAPHEVALKQPDVFSQLHNP